jgi:hypothetical protein
MLWSLGILALLAILIVQVGWWERGRWLQPPGMRAFAEIVCERIGCSLELPLLADNLAILEPALSERGEAPDGLRVTLTLVNRAKTNQSLPQLQLELYDDEGELAAAGRFGPESYLSEEPPGKRLAPGESVRPTLDLEPPPMHADGFRIKLF